MPFKSVKQRRYLWKNEPALAKKWTKKYGSKIKKGGSKGKPKTKPMMNPQHPFIKKMDVMMGKTHK